MAWKIGDMAEISTMAPPAVIEIIGMYTRPSDPPLECLKFRFPGEPIDDAHLYIVHPDCLRPVTGTAAHFVDQEIG